MCMFLFALQTKLQQTQPLRLSQESALLFSNTKLAIRQIPPELNNISKLNEHFSKFGTIVNLQVL